MLALPEWQVQIYEAFLQNEPAPDERVVLGLAQLTALVFNRTRGSGETGKSVADALLCRDPWGEEQALPSALDAQVMSRLDSIGRKRKG